MLEKKKDYKASEDESEKETPYKIAARKMLGEAAEADEAGGEAIKSMVRKHLAFAVCMTAIECPKMPDSKGTVVAELAKELREWI